jgi:hypothetical protein
LRENRDKARQVLKIAADGTTLQIDVAPFFKTLLDQDTAPTGRTFKNNCWGGGSKSQNKQPIRTAAEALEKFQISNFLVCGTRKFIWWLDFA